MPYTRTRTFLDNPNPVGGGLGPALDAGVANEWEAAHQDASTRLNVIEAGNTDIAKAPGTVLYVTPAGNDTADGLSWKTAKATLGAAISALTAGGVIEVAGLHTITSALPQPADYTVIRGRSSQTRITYSGTGPMVSITNGRQVHFENLRFSLTAASSTAFYIYNSFRCSWSRCVIDGGHTGTTGSTFHPQVGFQFRGNAGDCRIINCDLNTLGEAVQTDTIMNYMIGCVIGNCWTGVHVDAGSFTGGMAVDDCTFVGTTIGAAAVRAHFLIDVPANQSWITNSWFEGCTTAVQIGTNTGTVGGPVGMVIANCKLAGTTKCLDIQAGRQTRLDGIRFSTDAGVTPTELTIDATNAPDGFASGLVSTATFDVLRTLFPPNWTYFARTATESQIAGPSLYIGNGVTAGNPSYTYLGNGRARFGYDGSKTIVSDATGGRDVALISGSSPRQLLTAGSDGNAYLGSKTAGSSNGGGGVVCFVMQNAVTLPTTNPAGGGILYVDAGALKFRGSSGTVTVIAPA